MSTSDGDTDPVFTAESELHGDHHDHPRDGVDRRAQGGGVGGGGKRESSKKSSSSSSSKEKKQIAALRKEIDDILSSSRLPPLDFELENGVVTLVGSAPMQAREELEIVTARLLSVRGVTSVVGEHILEKIKKREDRVHIPHGWRRFVAGYAAEQIATLFSHPLDLLKVRQQQMGRAALPVTGSLVPVTVPMRPSATADLAHLFRTRAMYTGLTASQLRQALFAIRHGLYGQFLFISGPGEEVPGLGKRMAAGLAAGAVAAVLSHPADIVLVRMQRDSVHPETPLFGYRNGLSGLVSVIREGSATRGVSLQLARAAIITSTQIPSYELTKHMIASYWRSQADPSLHLTCAVAAAVVMSIASCPIDNIKNEVMIADKGDRAVSAAAVVKNMGLKGLFRGLPPLVLRMCVHQIPLWMSLEWVYGALQV